MNSVKGEGCLELSYSSHFGQPTIRGFAEERPTWNNAAALCTETAGRGRSLERATDQAGKLKGGPRAHALFHVDSRRSSPPSQLARTISLHLSTAFNRLYR